MSLSAEVAKELIRIGGKTGNVIVQGNWGASNTDAKLAGFKSYLQANSSWKIVAEVNDKATAEDAIEGAKAALNAHKDATGFAGLNSEAGTALRTAMKELNMRPGSIKAVVNDRQAGTLDAIKEGYVDETLINKTATQAYMAIAMLELYNRFGAGGIPVSSDNKAADINAFPELMYMGKAVISKSTLKYFEQSAIPTYTTPLYH